MTTRTRSTLEKKYLVCDVTGKNNHRLRKTKGSKSDKVSAVYIVNASSDLKRQTFYEFLM